METIRIYNDHTGEVLEKHSPIPQMLITTNLFWTFWKPDMNDFIMAKNFIKTF